MGSKYQVDVLILGAGVVGLATGIAVLESNPSLRVIIAEKEERIALHASGRNSGVLHAGFYYSPDSLKAKFCSDGNQELRKLASKYGIPIREVGKVVVVQNESEVSRLDQLAERGSKNGIDLEMLDASHLPRIEPLAKSFEKFLWSPTTAVADPIAIIEIMRQEFEMLGGKIHFKTKLILQDLNGEVREDSNRYDAKKIINAAGTHADRISRAVGVGLDYAMIPFMGVYRATEQKYLPLRRLVYPVPHPVNPFLGVHFTITINHKVKIGPTAIPIVGREQYSPFVGLSFSDISQTLKGMYYLASGDSHNLQSIVKKEWPKIFEHLLVRESVKLVPEAAQVRHWKKQNPGIRAQLVHLPSKKLEQDFVVESKRNAFHILNAVSPGWTSSLPFGRYIADQVLKT
jgi:L-2-hydroxyglutarate oxidase